MGEAGGDLPYDEGRVFVVREGRVSLWRRQGFRYERGRVFHCEGGRKIERVLPTPKSLHPHTLIPGSRCTHQRERPSLRVSAVRE